MTDQRLEMQTYLDIPFQPYRNKVYTFDADQDLNLGYEQESTFCSCKQQFLDEFSDPSPCARHSFASMNPVQYPQLFGDQPDIRTSFGELSSYSNQEHFPLESPLSPSFIDPDVVIRKSEFNFSSDDAFIQENGVSDMANEPNLINLDIDEQVQDTRPGPFTVNVLNMDESRPPTNDCTVEPWNSEQTLLISREGTRRTRRNNESTYFNRTKKSNEQQQYLLNAFDSFEGRVPRELRRKAERATGLSWL